MKVAIVDYGMGNLGSVARALAVLGAEPAIVDQPAAVVDAGRIVLPGVGSFSEGMERLKAGGWVPALRDAVLGRQVPLLGICLGMQLLASHGTEGGAIDGLGLVPGTVERLDRLGCTLRIPHVGWNDIRPKRDSALLAGIPAGTDFYFVHSYAFRAADEARIIATTDYGLEITAAVAAGSAWGTQFHPEKSARAGSRVLRNFLEAAAC